MPTQAIDTTVRRFEVRATLLAIANADKSLTVADRLALSLTLDLLERPAPTERMAGEQRSALFAAYSNVFADPDDPAARYAFTRMALGLPSDATVSWSRYGAGALTAEQASKVLDALAMLGG
jgi:hypothetical protein